MDKKNYKKRFEFHEKLISRKNEQIKILESQIQKLKLELESKDKTINSVAPLKNELIENVNEIKKYKEEYKSLIEELKKMKKILNQTVYKGRWKLVKFLIK